MVARLPEDRGGWPDRSACARKASTCADGGRDSAEWRHENSFFPRRPGLRWVTRQPVGCARRRWPEAAPPAPAWASARRFPVQSPASVLPSSSRRKSAIGMPHPPPSAGAPSPFPAAVANRRVPGDTGIVYALPAGCARPAGRDDRGPRPAVSNNSPRPHIRDSGTG